MKLTLEQLQILSPEDRANYLVGNRTERYNAEQKYNTMNQTHTIARIISERLPWRILDSAGREVQKPQSRTELELLLILHKDGIKVEATSDKGMPHPLQVELDAMTESLEKAKEEVWRLREQIENMTSP